MSDNQSPGTPQVFLARQPIFDHRLKLHAYELLSRSGLDNFYAGGCLDKASSKVIADSSMLLDLDSLVSGKRAFVNVTRDVILKGFVEVFPAQKIVVEVLENVTVDDELVAACTRLRNDGYLLALDDFKYSESLNPLVGIADILKVDFLQTDARTRAAIVERFGKGRARLLAEKVETREMLHEAQELGYTMFQGFFFARPEIVAAQDVPGYKLHLLELLNELHRPELDFGDLEQVIKRDLSLCYKLLRYINSAQFGFRQEIDSIRRALIILGQEEVRKWATLVALTGLGRDKPLELISQTIVRARLCETLASYLGLESRRHDLFLMGMFSMIDAVLGRPLDEVLFPLPISEEIKQGLLGATTGLSVVYDFCLDYERGNWTSLDRHTPKVDEPTVVKLYIEAVEWAADSLRLVGRAD
jgi:EAL and modified HD-GYP domain-containing signal transduction protein